MKSICFSHEIFSFPSSGCYCHGSLHVVTFVFLFRTADNITINWLQYHPKYVKLTTAHFFPCSSNTGGFLAAAALGLGATTAGFGLSGTGPVFLSSLFLWVFSSSFTFLSPVWEEETNNCVFLDQTFPSDFPNDCKKGFFLKQLHPVKFCSAKRLPYFVDDWGLHAKHQAHTGSWTWNHWVTTVPYEKSL